MNTKLVPTALAIALLATAAHAQTSGLNLKLPPGSVPASSSTAPAPAKPSDAPPAMDAVNTRPASAGTAARPAPGVYYGDTSGRTAAQDEAEAEEAARPHCDDATYNQPQVHGSVGMGVVTGNHWGSGTYNSGAVNITQRTGDCSHPTGSIGLSIGVSRFNGR